jgi:hypothetical protein
MKVLNIIKIKDGKPQILEAFVFYKDMSDSVSQEIIERAEYRYCKLLVGLGYEIQSMDKKVYQLAVMEGYNNGVIMASTANEPEYSLHLVWSNIED